MLALCVPYTFDAEERLQWNYIFNNWPIDKIYFIGDNWDADNDVWQNHFTVRNKEVVFIESYDQINDTLVFVSPKEAKHVPGLSNLKNYRHPSEKTNQPTVCYVFGPNEGYLEATDYLLSNDRVYIDVIGELYSWVAAAIVLYDRDIKNGG